MGCGPGTFLLAAAQRGWKVVGIEPSAMPAAAGRAKGLDVFHGYVQDYLAHHPREFDAITCFEVLEHVPQPVDILRAIHHLLAPDGVVILSVPNRDDPYCLRQQIQPAMPPVHINFFNRQSLEVACRAALLRFARFKSLPIPTSSVRNTHGTAGFLFRAPLLLGLAVLGHADGTTLVALARKQPVSDHQTVVIPAAS